MRKGINLERTWPVAVGALLLAATALPAAAQRVLDLPMRTAAGADALASGAIAVFWNPGALGIPSARGEALVMDVRGPAATSVDGVGAAVVIRLDERTAIGLGYQRFGIDDIEQTTTTPLPDNGALPIELAENSFSFAAMRAVGRVSIGANVLYTRIADYIGGDDVVAIGTGFRWTSELPFEPVIAAGVRYEDIGADWFAGASVTRMLGADSVWRASAEYGANGSARFRGIAHRLAALVTWRDRYSASAAIVAEPGAEGHTFKPALGLNLRITRYQLGVLREDLPNGVGAVHSFRLGVFF